VKKLKKLKTLSIQGGACGGSYPRRTSSTYKYFNSIMDWCESCGSSSYYQCSVCDENCDLAGGGGGGGVPYFEQN